MVLSFLRSSETGNPDLLEDNLVCNDIKYNIFLLVSLDLILCQVISL